jgi:hypothetical protein
MKRSRDLQPPSPPFCPQLVTRCPFAADIYNDTNGDPPPGMVWWNYNSDIDPRAWNTTPYEYFLITTNATYAEQFRT